MERCNYWKNNEQCIEWTHEGGPHVFAHSTRIDLAKKELKLIIEFVDLHIPHENDNDTSDALIKLRNQLSKNYKASSGD